MHVQALVHMLPHTKFQKKQLKLRKHPHPRPHNQLISLQIARSTDILIGKLGNFHMNGILAPTV